MMALLDSVVGRIRGPTTNGDDYMKRIGGKEAAQFSQLCESTVYRFDNDQNPPPTFTPLEGSPSSFPFTTNVVEKDCLLHAHSLVLSGKYKHVAVLNMANEYNCGGAWSVHWGSQEEYLFRNTTLPLPLWKHRRHGQDKFRSWSYGTELLGPPCDSDEDRWYPFTKCGGIFSPTVEVHSLVDKPLPPDKVFTISVLTMAAQDLRHKSKQGPFLKELLLQKMRTLFFMAAENNCDALVLGAFGCGAFRNDPAVVAGCFATVLEEMVRAYPVGSFPFRCVDFPIIKSQSNLNAFRQFFQQ